MANEEHLARLRAGVEGWNAWRKENPDIVPDLFGANLGEANLSGVDLSEAALIGANLRSTNLSKADLHRAQLHGALLLMANLGEANLSGANLVMAILIGANFSKADLSEAILFQARLLGAVFSRANLCDADLQQATLIDSCLDGATLTGAKMWGTQRDGWSIKDVTCQRVFWDRNGEEPTDYRVGDFERIFAEKPRIVLRYPGGLSPVELAMLPLIIERLQAEHPDCVLHIRSVQDDGSGAVVTITVDDLANRRAEVFESEIAALRNESTTLQHQLRHNEKLRLVAEGKYEGLKEFFRPVLNTAMRQDSHNYYYGPYYDQTLIGGDMSGDTYNIPGQAGAVGPHSHSHDMTFQQLQSNLDLPKLAEELGRLRTAMKQETEGTREQDKAVVAVAEAEDAAIKGDGPTALQHLKTAGKWALGIAKEIGVPVAVEAMKKLMM